MFQFKGLYWLGFPFGNLKITGLAPLPLAFRCLERPHSFAKLATRRLKMTKKGFEPLTAGV